MLSLQTVTKRYGRETVLDQLSADFPVGLSLLTGPSGAGKSTLLRLCATAEKATSGAIVWNGQPLAKQKRALRSELGYGPQIVDLPLDITAMEFMSHVGTLKGLGRGLKDQARSLLAEVGLGGREDARIGVYSGGMRRRLIFAQALLGTPKLIALDEPTAELDAETANTIIKLIHRTSLSATVLVTTHLSDGFADAAPRIFRVADGKIAAI